MSEAIPESLKDLVSRDAKAMAYLALVKRDGTPHVTPIWFDYDGEFFIFNTARGRVKDRIMHRKPVVAFVITDLSNPGRYLQVTGRVVAETEEAAYEQIQDLSLKYNGTRQFVLPPGQTRVTYKVLPEKISGG
jgi:PPOX class probable F420-dependent enzyme